MTSPNRSSKRSDTKPKPDKGAPRRRDAEASRAAILKAAREVFAERGYAQATIREIAKRAGFTHGLVMRHFGSKEDLLIAALPGPRDLPAIIPGDIETLPERIAETFVRQTEAARSDHALIALIRSAAGGDETSIRLHDALRKSASDTYLQILSGPEAEVQIELLFALLLGVTFSRHVARSGRLAEMAPNELIAHLTIAIRAVLAPVDAEPEG